MNQVDNSSVYLFTLNDNPSDELQDIFSECQRRNINIDAWAPSVSGEETNLNDDIELVTKTLQTNTIIVYINSKSLKCVPKLKDIVKYFKSFSKPLIKNDQGMVGYTWAFKESLHPSNENTKDLVTLVPGKDILKCTSRPNSKRLDYDAEVEGKELTPSPGGYDPPPRTNTTIVVVIALIIFVIILMFIVYEFELPIIKLKRKK